AKTASLAAACGDGYREGGFGESAMRHHRCMRAGLLLVVGLLAAATTDTADDQKLPADVEQDLQSIIGAQRADQPALQRGGPIPEYTPLFRRIGGDGIRKLQEHEHDGV